VDILSAAPGTAQRVVVVLDISGSMAWKWRRLPDLLSALFRVSPEGTQFSVIVFGERVLEKIEFGHSRQEILSTIDQFAVRPGTWLVTREPKRVVRDSLLGAYDLLQPAQAGDSIIVATDERDDDSKMSGKTLGKQVQL